MTKLKINIDRVLERYDSILKPCPKCGELMTPLGDPPEEPYLWCFDCRISQPLEGEKSQ